MTSYYAESLIKSLGNAFFWMIGAKRIVTTERGIRFNVGRNRTKINFVEIDVNGLDLLDVRFIYKWESKKDFMIHEKIIKEYKGTDGLYIDMVKEVFSNITGLYVV